MKKHKTLNKIKIIIPLMLVVLAAMMVLSTAIGAVYVPFINTVKIIIKNFFGASVTDKQDAIIFFIRFPRVVIAALVGAALAVSGAVMQGIFRNPLVDPGFIGVSSGASFGVIIAIALGVSTGSIYFTPLFACAGALVAMAVVYILACAGGRTPALTLVLAGIAVSAFINAINSGILSFISEYQLKEYIFWTIGGLNGRSWTHFNLVFIPLIICLALLFTFSRDLNALMLGAEEAQSMGMNTSRVLKIALVLASITTALAVCVSGNIIFVGLVVPHIVRLTLGANHKILIPVSALGGAIFLVACDLISRVVIKNGEISVGIVTAFLGAPYFLYLLQRARRKGEIS